MGERGALRIYLGAAPGVGKTYAMLGEAHRRLRRGTDVVVGLVETHGRAGTAALLEGLEVLPRAAVTYRGAWFEELDVDAVLGRRPQVVVVDELAHTNAPGRGHAKRWQDVQELLAAGIEVLATVNVQHLESLNDVVQTITGVPQRETVPDAVVRAADQVELVDVAPEALRRRMAHGNIYPADRVDAALGNYFRLGNLTALRELALLWLAGTVDEQLDHYRSDHDVATTWETRERILVALTGGTEGETLIRRAARIRRPQHRRRPARRPRHPSRRPHRGALAAAGHAQPHQRRPAVRARRRRGRARRRAVACGRGRSGRLPAAQLLLHRADRAAGHRRAQQRAGARRLHGGGGDGQCSGGPGRPAQQPSRPLHGRGGDTVHFGR
jgi:hypothetical protein